MNKVLPIQSPIGVRVFIYHHRTGQATEYGHFSKGIVLEVNSIKKGVWLPHLLDDKAPPTAHNRTEASSIRMTDLVGV